MNWSKAVIAGAVGGVVMAVYEALVHGMIMSNTYANLAFFRQDASPIWYTVIAILVGIVGGIIFAKTRASWGAGPKGGMSFGLWLGILFFVLGFSYPLMIQGFPYYLTWCWGGISIIECILYGAVLGAMNKG